jgi:hypothetical protein
MDCEHFLASVWASRAAALNWSTRDLFGCDPHAPFARLDRQGLLWLINGGELVTMASESVTFKTFNRCGSLTYRRGPADPIKVNLWDLQNLQSLH